MSQDVVGMVPLRKVEVLVITIGEMVVQEPVNVSTVVVLCGITKTVALLRQIFSVQGSVTLEDVETVLVI